AYLNLPGAHASLFSLIFFIKSYTYNFQSNFLVSYSHYLLTLLRTWYSEYLFCIVPSGCNNLSWALPYGLPWLSWFCLFPPLVLRACVFLYVLSIGHHRRYPNGSISDFCLAGHRSLFPFYFFSS
ncbi:unnamed protein product, partial [Pylaiella littoralis]